MKNIFMNPFKKGIPDVSYFNLIPGNVDLLFYHLSGIELKIKNQKVIIPYKNKKLNRYIEHCVIRLNKAKDAGKSLLF